MSNTDIIKYLKTRISENKHALFWLSAYALSSLSVGIYYTKINHSVNGGAGIMVIYMVFAPIVAILIFALIESIKRDYEFYLKTKQTDFVGNTDNDD